MFRLIKCCYIILLIFGQLYSQDRYIVTEGVNDNTITYSVRNIGSFIDDDYVDLSGVTLSIDEFPSWIMFEGFGSYLVGDGTLGQNEMDGDLIFTFHVDDPEYPFLDRFGSINFEITDDSNHLWTHADDPNLNIDLFRSNGYAYAVILA